MIGGPCARRVFEHRALLVVVLLELAVVRDHVVHGVVHGDADGDRRDERRRDVERDAHEPHQSVDGQHRDDVGDHREEPHRERHEEGGVDQRDDEKRRHEALQLVHGEKVHGVVGQDGLAGRARYERRGELARDVTIDARAQRRDGIRTGEVVTDDDVGAGRVEVDELRKVASLQQQHVLRDQVRVVGNDLERRIAAIHLPVHLPDVVRDGDRLADLAGPGQEILEAGDLAEDLGSLTPSGRPVSTTT
jgi:hypothetical protein